MRITKAELQQAYALLWSDFAGEECAIGFDDELASPQFWQRCNECDRPTDAMRMECLTVFYLQLIRKGKAEEG